MALSATRSVLAVCLLAIFGVTAEAGVGDPPAIAATSITSAPTAGGAELTIFGANLTDSDGSAPTVTIGPYLAEIESAAASEVVVTIPEGQGADLSLVVQTDGGSATAPFSFSYEPPAIAVVTPGAGPSDATQEVVITGSNFGLRPRVLIGGLEQPVLEHDHGEIRILRESGLPVASYTLTVEVGPQVSGPALFDVTLDPPVDALAVSPPVVPAAGGTLIIVFGQGFGADAQVFVGGAPAETLFVNSQELEALAPAGVGTGVTLEVVSLGQRATLPAAIDYAAPQIFGVSAPQLGRLMIQGVNFGTSPTVTVDGAPAPVLESTDSTALVATLPIQETVNVVVTAGGQSSPPTAFTGPTTCDADLDGDGAITSADLGILLAAWGPCP